MKLPSHIPWSNKMSHEFNQGVICTLEKELLISSERLLTLSSMCCNIPQLQTFVSTSVRTSKLTDILLDTTHQTFKNEY